ncbi:hypothetical protein TNCV_4037511 [Trichonephila clavipes]|nr:hypothetical protein TNCV_4037511 [Trichonephila clavipes]
MTTTILIGTPYLNAINLSKKAYLLCTGAILDQEGGSAEQRPAFARGWADSRHFHKAWFVWVHNFLQRDCVRAAPCASHKRSEDQTQSKPCFSSCNDLGGGFKAATSAKIVPKRCSIGFRSEIELAIPFVPNRDPPDTPSAIRAR